MVPGRRRLLDRPEPADHDAVPDPRDDLLSRLATAPKEARLSIMIGGDKSVVDALQEINPDDLRADKLLDDIRKERNRTSRERQKLEKARKR